MPTASNAALYMEQGQDLNASQALTDNGDNKTFIGGDSLWSDATGFAPTIYPNGIVSGAKLLIIPAVSGTDDLVDVLAFTCNAEGALVSVSADTDVTIPRPTVSTHQILSVTYDQSADAILVVEGTEGTSFTETRNVAGGPPLIPVDDIELGQVRFSAQASAAVLASEIKQTPGTHREEANYPTHTIVYGDEDHNAGVVFSAALPTIHTGSVTKKVFAEWYDPQFSQVLRARNLTVPSITHSASSEQYYQEVLNSISKSLGQGSFEIALVDGITDSVSQWADNKLWFKFFPDGDKTPYVLMQGYLAVPPTYPADALITATCTITSEEEPILKSS